MPKITKACREAAAEICQLVALNTDVANDAYGSEIGAPDAPSSLAFEAWRAARRALNATGTCYGTFDRRIDAEAAALLRSGWSPGDDVPVRRPLASLVPRKVATFAR